MMTALLFGTGLVMFAIGIVFGFLGIRDRDAKILGFFLAIAGYMSMKFSSTGFFFQPPSGVGEINVDLILGLIFMALGLGFLVFTIQTKKTEFGLPLLAALMLILGFVNVHLSATSYMFPVQIVPLSVFNVGIIGGSEFIEIGKLMALAINFIGVGLLIAIIYLMRR